MQAAVVDAVQAALHPVVLTADTRHHLAVGRANRNEEGVHSVVHAARNELRKHYRRLAVQCRVAEIFLPSALKRGVNDELFGVSVVGRGRTNRGDITAVADLCHRERAGKSEGHHIGQPGLMVRLGAEVQNGCTKEAPLHAALDLQRGVGED